MFYNILLCSLFLFSFSLLYYQCFCIVLWILYSFILIFPIFVKVNPSLPSGGKSISVKNNIYCHWTIKILQEIFRENVQQYKGEVLEKSIGKNKKLKIFLPLREIYVEKKISYLVIPYNNFLKFCKSKCRLTRFKIQI
jgi:hypothetical protein